MNTLVIVLVVIGMAVAALVSVVLHKSSQQAAISKQGHIQQYQREEQFRSMIEMATGLDQNSLNCRVSVEANAWQLMHETNLYTQYRRLLERYQEAEPIVAMGTEAAQRGDLEALRVQLDKLSTHGIWDAPMYFQQAWNRYLETLGVQALKDATVRIARERNLALVELAKRGDGAAFGLLLTNAGGYLTGFVNNLGVSADDWSLMVACYLEDPVRGNFCTYWMDLHPGALARHAETAIQARDILLAKMVLAYWHDTNHRLRETHNLASGQRRELIRLLLSTTATESTELLQAFQTAAAT
jgi:hypothetical protein